MKQLVVVSAVVAAALLSGCKSTPPRVAQDKTVSVNGTDYVFGGVYNVDKNKLELSINGDPAMKGSFPPYTPTLNMSTKYKGEEFSSYCYFGSVLQEQGGAFGAIAGVIQGSNNKSGDKCEIKVAGEIKEHLYF